MSNTEDRWTFATLRSGYERSTALWLYPEINMSSVLGNWADDELTGEEQVQEHVSYVRKNAPDEWEQDAVPICWCVRGEGVSEIAPFQHGWEWCNFLTRFSHPVRSRSGEVLNWFTDLPVRNDRFPKFAKALRWTPSPFQTTCPLRSIISGVRVDARTTTTERIAR